MARLRSSTLKRSARCSSIQWRASATVRRRRAAERRSPGRDQPAAGQPLVEQGGGRPRSPQTGPGNHDRESGDRVAGEAPHGIAGPEQHAHARLRHHLDTVDHFLGQPLERQPEHPVAALLAQQFQPAAAVEEHQLEFSHGRRADVGLEGGRTRQEPAAVVAEGAGDEALPCGEVVAAQNRVQARSLQQLQWLHGGQGAGEAGSVVPPWGAR